MIGLSLYGGILGAFLVLLAVVRYLHLDLLSVLDAFTVPSGAAFCISRVGCFLNGCCKGKPTDFFLGVVFPERQKPILSGLLGAFMKPQPVHPTQLYELFGAALGLPVCHALAKRWKLSEGGLFLLYGVWFCLMRLAVLPLRKLNYPEPVRGVLYPLLYLGLAALGVALLLRRRKIEKTRGETAAP
jgi:phosphatidylglycerol:prolipoprotein diacylglycerol transferase